EDVLAGKAAVVRPAPHRKEDLRREDDVRPPREVADRPADDLLALPDRVHVRGVEERDPELEGASQERAGGLLVEDPGAPGRRAVAHAAEREAGDHEAGGAEADRLHGQIVANWPSSA